MKKLMALILALALCLGLCACGQEKAAESGDRSDVTVTPIPKPDAASASGQIPAPTEAPTPAETPAPTAQPPEIEVEELFSMSGAFTNESGYSEYYSWSLPLVSGADTPYIRQINEDMQGIYKDYVESSLNSMEEYSYIPCYCISFRHNETDGIHSLLVTCDNDYDMTSYHCYNFDAYGNEVTNETLLETAGVGAERFVTAARDRLAELTDYGEYYEDDGWKELQAQTIAADNCSVDMPMVLLPDGSVAFVATIYTPAGAGAYDRALAYSADGGVTLFDAGSVLRNRLYSSYLVDASGTETEEDTAYMLEFFSVGDTLSVEVTGFDPASGSVYYYYAADIYPEDPSALLSAEASVPVRVLSYCPDVFGGMYYGEPGYYTMTVEGSAVSFTDYAGGTPLLGRGEDLTAHICYPDDLGLDDPVPGTDYDRFDFDRAEASGIVGTWGGQYMDRDNVDHTVCMELTSWGGMILRDCVEGGYPRILKGSYYLSGEGDEFAPESGMVVFNLVAVGGYKMPVMGYCSMDKEENGRLLVADPDDTAMAMLLDYTDYYCVMTRVSTDRRIGEPQVIPLEENESVQVDLRGDGEPAELSFCFTRDKDAGDAITGFTVVMDGEEYNYDDHWIYDADVYLILPTLRGEAYLYVDGLSDNDYHYTVICAADGSSVRVTGEYYGGFAEEPADPENLRLAERFQLLSTCSGARSYRVGMNGIPEATEPFFRVLGDVTLTTKQDVDCWIADSDTGELIDSATLPAGEKVTLLRTDGVSFFDLLLENGDCRRVWIDSDGWPQTVNGVDIEECFDGVRFAG